MLEIIIPILIFAVIIIGLMFLFSKYTEFLARITVNRMKKKIDSGKISDKKLIKLYKENKVGIKMVASRLRYLFNNLITKV